MIREEIDELPRRSAATGPARTRPVPAAATAVRAAGTEPGWAATVSRGATGRSAAVGRPAARAAAAGLRSAVRPAAVRQRSVRAADRTAPGPVRSGRAARALRPAAPGRAQRPAGHHGGLLLHPDGVPARDHQAEDHGERAAGAEHPMGCQPHSGRPGPVPRAGHHTVAVRYGSGRCGDTGPARAGGPVLLPHTGAHLPQRSDRPGAAEDPRHGGHVRDLGVRRPDLPAEHPLPGLPCPCRPCEGGREYRVGELRAARRSAAGARWSRAARTAWVRTGPRPGAGRATGLRPPVRRPSDTRGPFRAVPGQARTCCLRSKRSAERTAVGARDQQEGRQ